MCLTKPNNLGLNIIKKKCDTEKDDYQECKLRWSFLKRNKRYITHTYDHLSTKL